jgi:hypothetical protein
MDFAEMLERYLSSADFGRMQAFIAGMEPSRRAALLQFIADREVKAPAVGDPAPDFDLPLLGSDRRVRLSSFRGVQPVALVFGSYT